MANFSDLPPRARERATALRNAADVAQAGVTELSSKLRDLRWHRQEIFTHIRVATDRRFSGGRDILAEGEVEGERQRLRELDDEIARLDAIVDAQTAAYASARALTERIDLFLRGLSGCGISDHFVAAPPLKKGEDLRAAIESRRRRVRELIAERAAVEAAPIPSAEAKRIAHEQVERLAERGRVNVGPLLTAGESFKFAAIIGLVKIPQVGAGEVAQTDVEGLVCWLLRDHLVAALEREIDAQSDDAHALDDRQRAARIEQIENELLSTERAEAALIESAREQGVTVVHRGDISVPALLGVEIAAAAEAA